jgi:hypothetical protein
MNPAVAALGAGDVAALERLLDAAPELLLGAGRRVFV